jgi:hypothetical protein
MAIGIPAIMRAYRVVVRISRRLGCGRWPAYASVADPVSYRCAQGNRTGCLPPGAHNDAASSSGLRSCSRKMTASRIEGPLPTPRRPCISKSTGLVTKLAPTYFESGWGRRPRQRMAGTGRTPRPVDRYPTKALSCLFASFRKTLFNPLSGTTRAAALGPPGVGGVRSRATGCKGPRRQRSRIVAAKAGLADR